MASPRVVLESVDPKSCLPTLPIPGRPPFAVRVDVLGGGELRVHVQQLPNGYPAPPFEVALSGSALHLVAAPTALPEGTTFCDLVVRISDVPAGDLTLVVEQRDPDTRKVRTLGTVSVGAHD